MAAKFALCLLPLAFAAQQTVQVGAQGLQFLPNTVYAGVGDTIQFEFVTPGHSVVQGTYSKPCIPASDSSFFSGVLDANMAYTLTINDTKPIFYYCSVAGHCQSGMVAVINPGSGDQTLNGYRSAAAGTSSSSEPSDVEGGLISAASSSSSVPASSVSSTGTATTSASASATAKSAGVRISGMGFLGFIGAMAAVLVSI